MARRSITFESAQGAVKSRSLVICRSNRKWMGSYIGTRFAVMINTAATLGASARDHGWYGMRAVRTGRRSGVWARTHRVAHDASHARRNATLCAAPPDDAARQPDRKPN